MTSRASSHGQGTPCIGILGSGQLGRMIAIAAAQLGIRTHVYAPDAQASSAEEVATTTTTASYDDIESLRQFAASVDAVTSEFENVPAATMQVIGESCLASPGAAALQAAQHRIVEKTLAASLGIALWTLHGVLFQRLAAWALPRWHGIEGSGGSQPSAPKRVGA